MTPGGQAVSQEGDLFVFGARSDESSVQRVPPKKGQEGAGDEQGQPVESHRYLLGPVGGDVLRQQPGRER